MGDGCRGTGNSASSSGIFSMIFRRGGGGAYASHTRERVGGVAAWFSCRNARERASLSSHLAGFVDGRRRCAGNTGRGWWTGAERR